MGMFKKPSISKLSTSIFSKYKKVSTSTFSNSNVVPEKELPNPKPDNYKVVEIRTIKKFLILEINYPDCINFEGNKILVYENCTIEDLKKQKLIDPHFSDNKKFISPIARFEPTSRGWKFALSFCNNFSENSSEEKLF